MVVLFFSDKGLPLSWAIRKITKSDYSHVGFCLEDGTCIDSTYRYGVHKRRFSDVERESSRLILIEYPDIPSEAAYIAETQLGKPYDATAICGYLMNRNWQDEDSWFCSELVAWAVEKSGFHFTNEQMNRITPQDILTQLPREKNDCQI